MIRSKIISSAPVLLVADVVGSANWYRDKLGFSYDHMYGEPPGQWSMVNGQMVNGQKSMDNSQ